MVKYLLTVLTIFTPFVPMQEVHDDFTTFETASYFNDAFGDLSGYELDYFVSYDDNYGYEYDELIANYYFAFPIYYDFTDDFENLIIHYSNDEFNFYWIGENSGNYISIHLLNYVGVEEELYFGRLNSSAMTTYIENEKGKDVVSDIIGTITSMVTGLLGGIGTGVVGMFNSLFLDGSNISSLGIWIIVLLGLSIALGAVAWVSTLIRGKQR